MIDAVIIQRASGDKRVDVHQFVKMPFARRIRFIAENKVHFLAGDDIVPTREALTALQKARA